VAAPGAQPVVKAMKRDGRMRALCIADASSASWGAHPVRISPIPPSLSRAPAGEARAHSLKSRHVDLRLAQGSPEDPGWYKNLAKTPEVELQVKDEVFRARARKAEGEECARLWRKAIASWPDYEEYAKRTAREIPVVVIER
jgi:deazaflavin-dependent oxidoreductase (nitroreductase family)